MDTDKYKIPPMLPHTDAPFRSFDLDAAHRRPTYRPPDVVPVGWFLLGLAFGIVLGGAAAYALRALIG